MELEPDTDLKQRRQLVQHALTTLGWALSFGGGVGAAVVLVAVWVDWPTGLILAPFLAAGFAGVVLRYSHTPPYNAPPRRR